MALSASDFENQHWTKTLAKFSPSVKRVHHHPQHLSISRNRTFFENRLFGGPDPWQEVRQASVEADALEVPRNTGRLKLEVSATEIFRENNSHGDERNLRLKQLVGPNNFATLKKTSKNKKHFTFSNWLPAQKVTSNFSPRKKNTGKFHGKFFRVSEKCENPSPLEAGRAQESGGWVWRFGGAKLKKGKTAEANCRGRRPNCNERLGTRQLLDSHSG